MSARLTCLLCLLYFHPPLIGDHAHCGIIHTSCTKLRGLRFHLKHLFLQAQLTRPDLAWQGALWSEQLSNIPAAWRSGKGNVMYLNWPTSFFIITPPLVPMLYQWGLQEGLWLIWIKRHPWIEEAWWMQVLTTNRGVTEWFDGYEKGVNHLRWSPQSPDLYPIEGLLHSLKA